MSPEDAEEEKISELFFKFARKLLKKWSKKNSLESYLHKNILLNLDVKKPLKILEKAHFKSLVKITFKVYFVEQIYSKEIDSINKRQSQKIGKDCITVTSDSTSSGSTDNSK